MLAKTGLTLALFAVANPVAHAQSAAEKEALAIQGAREGRVKARGQKVHYTTAFDLSGLPTYVPKETVTGTIRIWGMNYLTDGFLGEYWEKGFKKFHPNVKFEYTTKTALIGIPGLYTGLADIGAVNRKATFDETLAFQRVFGYHPLEIEGATGSLDVPGWNPALGIFVHRDNPITKLTLDQLDGIFGAERAGGWDGDTWIAENARGPEKNIRTWGQLGLTGKWAQAPIRVHGRPLRYHQQMLLERKALKGGDKWNEKLIEYAHDVKPDGTQGVSTKLMLEALSSDPFGIAFSDLASKTPEVKTVSLGTSQAGPYYEISLENVQSRKYPLFAEVYFYANQAPGKPLDPKVREYFRYMLSREGQGDVMRDGKFLPLTAGAVKAQLRKIE